MLSALLMIRRFLQALRVALRDEDFARILAAGVALVVVGTLVYTLGSDWSVVDGFYVAVATLTTSSIADPSLTITDGWLKVFTAFYVLVGIGILVEVARRLGMGVNRGARGDASGQGGQARARARSARVICC